MWIRFKADYTFREGDNKWKRVRYLEWLAYPAMVKNRYEIKEEFKQTEKQKESLLRGRILRHLTCAQAQLELVKRLQAQSTDGGEQRKRSVDFTTSSLHFARKAVDCERLHAVESKQTTKRNLT